MQKSIYIVLFLLSGLMVTAQECSIYFPMKQGSKMQYEVKDRKDKTISTTDYQIKKIENTSQGTVATIEASVTQGKKKMMDSQEFKAICKGDKLSVDFESLMPANMKDNFKNMDYSVDGTNLEYPTNLKVGQNLPDSNVTMTMSMGGMDMKISVDIVNRKVERKEKITTPAGTFDCYVVSFDTQTKTMGQTIESSTIQWLSTGVGMIQTEDYSKGKLESKTLLTSYSN